VELSAIHAEVFAARIARRDAAATRPAGTVRPCTLGDLEIIERAARMRKGRGEKFRRLWSGDTGGYRSHSEADLALCGYLAFLCGPDLTRIDELFRGSGLYRPKWERPDYRDSTISLAVQGRTEYYQPRRHLDNTFRPGIVRRDGVAYISFEVEV
jgi:primase-polymerase (primpol)-like protein